MQPPGLSLPGCLLMSTFYFYYFIRGNSLCCLNFFERSMSFTGRDQAPQTISYDIGPRVGTGIEAFIMWNQTQVSKTHFCFAVLFRDLKNDLCTCQLRFIFHKI